MVLKFTETEGTSSIPSACHRFPPSEQEGQAQRRSDRKGPVRWNARHCRQQWDTEAGPRAGSDRRRPKKGSAREVDGGRKNFRVAEACRQVPIDENDWYLLGCQIQQGSTVCVNKVGVFKVASASHYWSHVASATGRFAQYLVGNAASTWHMLVADDFRTEASGAGYREALIKFFLVCATCRVPLSWNKTVGGDTVVWAGFELLHRSYQLGISQRRAEWLVKWTRDVAGKASIGMKLCTSSSTTRRIPSYVAVIMRYFAHQVELAFLKSHQE